MSNIYVQAHEAHINVNRLTGFTALNYEIVRTHETLLEKMAVLSLTRSNIKEIIQLAGIGEVGRLASQRISQATNKVISNYTANDIQLVNLYPFTNEVFEEVKHLPSVIKLCGDPENEADYDANEKRRALFIQGLAFFVARQILIFKRRLGQSLDPQVREAVDLWIDAYDGSRGMHIAFHQIANKLVAGGLEPAEAKQELVKVSEEKRERLAAFVRANFGGYLAAPVLTVRHNSRLIKGA